MNEADTPNNWAFPEPLNAANSSEAEQANPYYSDLSDENTAPVNVPSEQAENQHDLDSPGEYWAEETDNGLAGLSVSELTKLVSLTEELRSTNYDLLDRIDELAHELAENQKALQWYKKRSQVAESMLNQQNQELALAQEQVKSLFYELEASHQTAQRQQILIETYKAQLETSQERLAQLERECAIVQTNYNEQSHQLLESENTCRELRNRLVRQQRQTLQFKVALEKCLEVPVPSFESDADTDFSSEKASRHLSSLDPSHSFFPKAQPIPPWSAEPEPFTQDLDDSWQETLLPPQEQPIEPEEPAEPPLQPYTLEPSAPDFDIPIDLEPAPAPEIAAHPTVSAAISPVESPNIEEQLDAVIQMFFDSQPTSESPQPENSEQQSDAAVDENWQAFATMFEEDPEPITATSLDSEVPLKEQGDSPASPEQSTSSFGTNTNWPSPLVYPLRPPKGRKTLASIDLPSFPQQ